MSKTSQKLSLVLGTALAATTLISASVHAGENPFSSETLVSGYQLADAGSKTSEAKCGADKKAEAKCAASKKAEAKCGADKKAEAKCGADKKAEAKCGADKKAEAKCGASK
ncbi:MAG: hypothetical protein RIR00_2097 [Pseudomonadota bacterium]|jgi:uncharacterized low-complexity protein